MTAMTTERRNGTDGQPRWRVIHVSPAARQAALRRALTRSPRKLTAQQQQAVERLLRPC